MFEYASCRVPLKIIQSCESYNSTNHKASKILPPPKNQNSSQKILLENAGCPYPTLFTYNLILFLPPRPHIFTRFIYVLKEEV